MSAAGASFVGGPDERGACGDDELLSELDRAVRGVTAASRAVERALGDMTVAQFRILGFVARDPLRATALAERAAFSKATLTGVIDTLLARGWIVRGTVDGDRRGVALSISRAGAVALGAAKWRAAQALAELLDELPPRRRTTTTHALGDLADAAAQRFARRHERPIP